MLSLIRIYVLPLREKSSSKSGADKRKITSSQRIIPIGLTCPQTGFHNFGASDISGKTYPFPTLSFRAQREIFFVPFFPPPSLSRLRETPPPPFLQYGVSRFSLPNTRPLAANKKDPSLLISPCQGRHGKYLKNYSRKFHVGVLASAWDLRHFVMPRILLCISESVCSRQSGTVPGSSRAELLCELPLASLLQIAPENVRNCKNGRIGRWPNAARRRY